MANEMCIRDSPQYNEFSGTVTSILSNRVIFVTDDYGNVRVFQVPDIPIIINGERGSFNNLNESSVKIIYEEDSFKGEVIGIIAYKATDVIVVDRDDLYKEGSRQFAGKNLPLSNSEVNFNKINIKGDAKSLEDIKVNDVVYFYETQNDKNSSLTLNVLRSQVEGVVTSVDLSLIHIFGNIFLSSFDNLLNEFISQSCFVIPSASFSMNSRCV